MKPKFGSGTLPIPAANDGGLDQILLHAVWLHCRCIDEAGSHLACWAAMHMAHSQLGIPAVRNSVVTPVLRSWIGLHVWRCGAILVWCTEGDSRPGNFEFRPVGSPRMDTE